MEKVKITQEQADALISMLSLRFFGNRKDKFLYEHYNTLNDEYAAPWDKDCLNEISFEKMALILYVGFEVSLPQAPETTEILNEVKADKGFEGILTEEELQYIEALIALPNTKVIWRAKFKKVLASHRLLLSANAELSFKNMKLQEENKEMSGAIDALQHQMWEGI